MNAKPRRVTWANDEDLRCAILAGMGFSTKLIMEQTGLSYCQVTYRLHKGKVYRADYRDGTSEMAKRVMDRALPGARDIVRILNLKVT